MIKDLKQRALHRTKILEGQMRGLQKMIDEDIYCVDILTQSLAIQKSLGSLNKLILENHIRTHVQQAIKDGTKEDNERTVKELLELYDLSKNKGK